MPRKKAPLEVTAEKPSLASLKLGTKSTSAEKKRAIKRIDAASSKKSTAVRLKHISDTLSRGKSQKVTVSAPSPKAPRTKKTPELKPNLVKKVASNEKAEAVSIARKNHQPSPLNIAEKLKQAVSRPDSPRSPYGFLFSAKPQKQIDIDELRPEEPVVRLPQNMSIRAREKALVILKSFTDDFNKSAEHISLISGLCFVLLGGYLALAFTGYMPGAVNQTAQLSSALSSTTESTISQTNTAVQPVLKIIDPLPKELTSPALFTFSLTNVKNVSVRVFSLETGQDTTLSVEQLVDATYRYKVEADKLRPGGYVVKTFSEHLTTNTKYSYILGEFKVPAPVSTASSTTNTTINTTTSNAEQTNTTEPAASSTTTTVKNYDYKIRLEGQAEISGQSVLKLVAPVEAKTIELYLRPKKSINSRFLGLAEKRSEAWYYFFNTLDVPNGDYELYGRSRINDVFVQSNSLTTKVNNVASPVLEESIPLTTADLEESTSEDGVSQSAESVAASSPTYKTLEAAETSVRTFSENTFLSERNDDLGTLKSAVSEVDIIFADYQTELSDVLKRYAVARQANDQKMLQLVENEFATLKERIQNEMIMDPDRNSLVDTFGDEFDARLLSLKKRIDTFEKLRNTAGVEDIALDSDADGISDYDERNLYRTDSHAVDTDGDGFEDGIEIMRGYDPRSPEGEVAIEYEYPQDAIGLEDADKLKIESVLPSVRQLSPESSVIQSEIRGRALPNSFVTLFIFSTPTVITVKTDDDGSFVYTFEKELEDGTHEVYAAVTDNTGAIVAHSRPFTFIKQAEAYTPVGSVEGVNTVTVADLKTFEMRRTVVGVGILALGAILVMLGFNLRSRRTPSVITNINDTKAA